jgi:hypothetical protein
MAGAARAEVRFTPSPARASHSLVLSVAELCPHARSEPGSRGAERDLAPDQIGKKQGQVNLAGHTRHAVRPDAQVDIARIHAARIAHFTNNLSAAAPDLDRGSLW